MLLPYNKEFCEKLNIAYIQNNNFDMKVCFTVIYRRLNYAQDLPAVILQ